MKGEMLRIVGDDEGDGDDDGDDGGDDRDDDDDNDDEVSIQRSGLNTSASGPQRDLSRPKE